MLNPSQTTSNQQAPGQSRPTNSSTTANQMHPMKSVLTRSPNIHEIEQMLANQRLSHNPNIPSGQMQPNLPHNQPPHIPNIPSHVQPNYFKLNPTTNHQSNPMGHLSAHQAGLRQQNVEHHAAPIFNVPNIRRYLDPNYENLNSLAGHPINSQLMNSAGIPISNPAMNPAMNAMSTTVNRNFISPNITGLPEASVIRKQNSPLSQAHIYANSSIVSRYCPPQQQQQQHNESNAKYPASQLSAASYRETNIDHIPRYQPPAKTNETTSKCSPSIATNDLNSLYDPVYYRTNSQLSFDSNPKDDSVTYSTYAPGSFRSLPNPAPNSAQPSSHLAPVSNSLSNAVPSAAAGNRQPITELFNNDANGLAFDKSLGSQAALKADSGIIDHLKNEKEVDYLTSLLVKGLESSTEADFFGICYKCGKTIYGQGCTFLGKLFHFDCFTCHTCGKALRGHAFYSMEGKPYCEQDYLSTLDKCVKCAKPILDRIIRALGNCYHTSCFCCEECNKCLDGIHFTVDSSGRLFCIEDFHEKFAPRCNSCKQPILPENNLETVRIVCMDKSYHVKCYKCEDCGTLLSSEKDGKKGCYPLDDHTRLCKECNNNRFRQYLIG